MINQIETIAEYSLRPDTIDKEELLASLEYIFNLNRQIELSVFSHIISIINYLQQSGDNLTACKVGELTLMYLLQSSHSDYTVISAKVLTSVAIVYKNTSDFAIAIDYLHKAKKLIEEVDNEIELTTSINGNLGLLYKDIGQFHQALECLTSVYEIRQRLNSPSLQSDLNNIGIVYLRLGDLDNAYAYFQRAKELSEINNNIQSSISAAINIGIVEYQRGNDIPALVSYEYALKVAEENHRPLQMADVFCNIGFIHDDHGDYKKALLCFIKAEQLYESVGNKQGLATVLDSIGVVFNNLGEYDNAIDYFKKGINICQAIGLQHMESTIVGNMGRSYQEQKDYASALEMYEYAAKTHHQSGSIYEEAVFTSNIGLIYMLTDELDRSLDCYMRALHLYNNLNDKVGIADVTGKIGLLKARTSSSPEDDREAERLMLESITLLSEVKAIAILLRLHRDLSRFYEKQSRYQEAYEHYIKYHELEKEVLNEEAKKSAERFHFERTLLEKENEQKLLHQRHEAEQEKIRLELHHKEKELESSINQIVEKNNFLQGISSDIQQFIKKHKTSNPEALERIIELIRKHISHGAVSGMIYDEITSVHGEFINRIKELYPDLTVMEVRISALLRMKLTSANIASLLFISQRTVEVHRLRIRKKLGIRKSDNLYVKLGKL